MIFVSHANPEDNDFARWLSLQLAIEGYPVWCDVTKLLGGEKFWEDIQKAISNDATKFVFVLSRNSNKKSGALDELNCALGAEKQRGPRFVITLRIDDIPYDEVYIGIQRRNHIDFASSWATGLSTLLARLQEDKVSRRDAFTPATVGRWWSSQSEYSARQGLLDRRETVLSNWFPIKNLPPVLYRHVVTREGIGKIDFNPERFSYPAARDSQMSFVSFASSRDFATSLPDKLVIDHTEEHPVAGVLQRTAKRNFSPQVSWLLRLAWEQMMQRTALRRHLMAGRSSCYYFAQGTIPNDRIYFTAANGKRSYREIIGYATRGERKRHWHYAIGARADLFPEPHLVVKGHVLFSDDGTTLWTDADKLAAARRSQCKNWWNDEWRDRLLAVMSHLAGEKGSLSLPVSSAHCLTLAPTPALFESPISYRDPDTDVKEEHDDYLFEDEDSEADEPSNLA